MVLQWHSPVGWKNVIINMESNYDPTTEIRIKSSNVSEYFGQNKDKLSWWKMNVSLLVQPDVCSYLRLVCCCLTNSLYLTFYAGFYSVCRFLMVCQYKYIVLFCVFIGWRGCVWALTWNHSMAGWGGGAQPAAPWGEAGWRRTGRRPRTGRSQRSSAEMQKVTQLHLQVKLRQYALR